MEFIKGTYIGQIEELKGETTILLTRKGGCSAQFDNLQKFNRHTLDYAFGWHKFEWSDFKLEEPEED